MLKISTSNLVMARCNVWCWLIDFMDFGFFLGRTVLYLWTSHKSLMKLPW